MTETLFAAGAAVFLLAFSACFRPMRVLLKGILRVLLAGVSLVVCNAFGLTLGMNPITLLFIAILGIPGIGALLAIHTLI